MNKHCQTEYNPWLHYIALLTAMVTFMMLGLGGLVTSHEAGMSVPDWPTSYGYNMFLFPISKWVGGIKYEHSHRLLGCALGLLSLTLAVSFWIKEPRRWLCWLGVITVVLVSVQGVLGGLRVRWRMDDLGIFHGTLAQLVLILSCSLVLFTSRWWLLWDGGKKLATVPNTLRLSVLATTILIFVQLMLGATMRGQHAGLAIHDLPLAYGQLWPDTSDAAVTKYNSSRIEDSPVTAFQIILQMLHRLGALAILLAVFACAWQSWRQLGGRDALAKIAVGWLILILCQITLGIATILTNKAADIATAHVLVGALSLVTGALWCVIAFRRTEAGTKFAPDSACAGVYKAQVAMAGNK